MKVFSRTIEGGLTFKNVLLLENHSNTSHPLGLLQVQLQLQISTKQRAETEKTQNITNFTTIDVTDSMSWILDYKYSYTNKAVLITKYE